MLNPLFNIQITSLRDKSRTEQNPVVGEICNRLWLDWLKLNVFSSRFLPEIWQMWCFIFYICALTGFSVWHLTFQNLMAYELHITFLHRSGFGRWTLERSFRQIVRSAKWCNQSGWEAWMYWWRAYCRDKFSIEMALELDWSRWVWLSRMRIVVGLDWTGSVQQRDISSLMEPGVFLPSGICNTKVHVSAFLRDVFSYKVSCMLRTVWSTLRSDIYSVDDSCRFKE